MTDLPLHATEDRIKAFFARQALEHYPLALNGTHNLALNSPHHSVSVRSKSKSSLAAIVVLSFSIQQAVSGPREDEASGFFSQGVRAGTRGGVFTHVSYF